MLALDALVAHLNRLAVDDLGPAMDHLHLVFFQQCGDAGGQAVNDAVFPFHALADVQSRYIHLNAQLRALAMVHGLLELLGHMDQRLGGNAANVQAGAAQCLAFHQNGGDAQLACANRRDITAGAAADNQQRGVQCLSHALTPGTGWRVVRAGREWPG